ncbi:MAG: endolytic transglycosylase MltG [Oscillospiraceae bacterium]|jgi:UPF0755 protein|nr:endolytic transglycosylase MltG [Oscillospiraceae bacterium]
MKRFFALFLLLALSLALLSACKDNGGGDVSSVDSGESGPATVKVTFAEGLTIAQFAKRLEDKGVCSAEEFINTCNNVDFSEQFSFLPSFDSLADRPYKLEGYLFPDTYEFFAPEGAESVIKRFLRNFESRVNEEIMADINSSDYSLDEIITLAAIVERETPSQSEMDKVAAVFFNRLRNKKEYPRLQSDATKYYPYVYGDTLPDGFESEYNTYNVKGLPKGPICAPSLAAIKGCVYPDGDTDAYFFYTDKNGKHYYAKTYKNHLKNIQYCKDNGLAG